MGGPLRRLARSVDNHEARGLSYTERVAYKWVKRYGVAGAMRIAWAPNDRASGTRARMSRDVRTAAARLREVQERRIAQ